MESKKIGFFNRIKLAITKFDAYAFLSEEKLSKSIGYFIKLILIFTLIISITLTIIYNNTLKEGIAFFEKEVPNFYFEDKILNVDTNQPVTIENNEFYSGFIAIDDINDADSEQVQQYKEKILLYNTGFIFLKDQVIMFNQVPQDFTTYNYDSIEESIQLNDLTKQSIIDFFNNSKTLVWGVVFISIFIAMFIVYIIIKLMDILILSILGYFVTKIYRIKMKYSEVFKMSIYALTLPIILECIYIVINLSTGFDIKYFSIMYKAVSFIYLITAILMIKTDLIKQQIEVQAIVDKQKEVHEEQENPDKQDKEDKKKEQEEKKKKQKKENEEGQAPEGSKA